MHRKETLGTRPLSLPPRISTLFHLPCAFGRIGSWRRTTRRPFTCASPASESFVSFAFPVALHYVGAASAAGTLPKHEAPSLFIRVKQDYGLLIDSVRPVSPRCFLPRCFPLAETTSGSSSEWVSWRQKTACPSTPSCKTRSRTCKMSTSSSPRTPASAC